MINGGVTKSSGFALGVAKPVDYKYKAATIADRNVTPQPYEGMLVYVDKNSNDGIASGQVYKLKPFDAAWTDTYGSVNGHWEIIGTDSSLNDRVETLETAVYDNIEPAIESVSDQIAVLNEITIPGIQEDILDLQTDITGIETAIDNLEEEISTKASTDVATPSINGLMAAADKGKLDGIAAGANNYVHPSTHPASIIVQDASNRFVTDADKATWNAKQASLVSGTNLKTVNGNSLLGSGDIVIESGGGSSETGATIKTKLETLTGADRLDAAAIKNLPASSGGALPNLNSATGTTFTLSTTEATVGSVSFTPSNATAKIMVIAVAEYLKDSTNTIRTVTTRIRRNATTQIGDTSSIKSIGTASTYFGPSMVIAVDTPNTTSAVTYDLRMSSDTGAPTVTRWNIQVFEISTRGIDANQYAGDYGVIRSVATVAAMNAIPLSERRTGMIVTVLTDTTTTNNGVYQLRPDNTFTTSWNFSQNGTLNSAQGGNVMFGSNNTVNTSANNAFVSGLGNTVNNTASVAFGTGSLSTGIYSFAGGYQSEANSHSAFAFGYQCKAYGIYNVAMGVLNTANGHRGATAFGWLSTASGGYGCFAVGDQVSSSGNASFATGWHSNASADYAFAGGYGTYASAARSFSFGNSNSVAATDAAALGGAGNIIQTAATNSVVLGGSAITATKPDTVYMSKLVVKNFPVYADNASASAGGLEVGTCYRTATGELRVVI